MLKLTAVYNQTQNQYWNAFIEQAPHIRVVQAEDLASARVILKIITAEEVAHLIHRRPDYEIIKEEVNYYQLSDKERAEKLRHIFGGN